MEKEIIPLEELDIKEDTIIKVMGVGGGGCNAVNYMYKQGIQGVTFLICNTDKQQLGRSSVPAKLQMGPGLGAGGKPEKAQEYAENCKEKIREALDDGTQMLFLAAGMGGGTGTGATSIVAQVAQDMGILTVGIVTIPFAFEGKPKINKAMMGVAKLAEHVDALLIINNEKLKQIYPDLNLLNAFAKSDDIICNAAKSIAEIITVPGYINTDFADVYNTLKDGHVAIMNIGQGNGEERIHKAIENALQSPLVNQDVHGARRVLLQLYCSAEHAIVTQEIDQIAQFTKELGDNVEVQWGISIDESLGEDVRVTIIATGYEVSDIPSLEGAASAPSIEDAIKHHYDDIKTNPTEDNKEPQPEENNTPEIATAEPETKPTATEVDLTGDPDIAIDIEGNQRPNEDEPTQVIDLTSVVTEQQPVHRNSRFMGGWLRGRKEK